jgi:hypothetical protein
MVVSSGVAVSLEVVVSSKGGSCGSIIGGDVCVCASMLVVSALVVSALVVSALVVSMISSGAVPSGMISSLGVGLGVICSKILGVLSSAVGVGSPFPFGVQETIVSRIAAVKQPKRIQLKILFTFPPLS